MIGRPLPWPDVEGESGPASPGAMRNRLERGSMGPRKIIEAHLEGPSVREFHMESSIAKGSPGKPDSGEWGFGGLEVWDGGPVERMWTPAQDICATPSQGLSCHYRDRSAGRIWRSSLRCPKKKVRVSSASLTARVISLWSSAHDHDILLREDCQHAKCAAHAQQGGAGAGADPRVRTICGVAAPRSSAANGGLKRPQAADPISGAPRFM